MSKVFFYIDESKKFKEWLLFLGWIYSTLNRSHLEKRCVGLIPTSKRTAEYKSTNIKDRELFEKILEQSNLPFTPHTKTYNQIYSDKKYVECLGDYIHSLLTIFSNPVHEICIYADFLWLEKDMNRLEATLAKSFSKRFGIPVQIYFLNSSAHITIQFADLIVGIAARNKKSLTVSGSSSESKTSLRAT